MLIDVPTKNSINRNENLPHLNQPSIKSLITCALFVLPPPQTQQNDFIIAKINHSEAMVQYVQKFLPVLFFNISKKKRLKMEKVCKLCCWYDYFKTLVQGETDSSSIVYILLKNHRLKIVMNRLELILTFSAL